MAQNSNASTNWKWNYFHDNLPNPDKMPTVSIKDSAENSKTKAPIKQKTSTKDAKQGSLREHSFYTDFDAFSTSLMEREEYSEYAIRETDLLSDVETVDSPAPSTAVRSNGITETQLLVHNTNTNVKDSSLTGTDDELADEYNKAYLNLDGKEESEDLQKGNKDNVNEVEDQRRKHDIFGDLLSVDSSSSKMKMNDLMKFDDIESEYFETDCDTMDSGIFPNREAEYFQDIGSDFFDEDEDEEVVSPLSLSKLSDFKINDRKNGDNCLSPSSPLSPSSSLPPGKTATMSNSLLRSTICELERALSDSNKLLVQRDEKMQVLRARNNELKKTLSKEVENNRKMKRLVSEKEKTILENQTKIIDLNQQIHDLNTKLSKLRTEKMQENHATSVLPSTTDKSNIIQSDDNADHYNHQDDLLIHQTTDEKEEQMFGSNKTVNLPCLISTVPQPLTPTKPPLPPPKQRNHQFDVNSELKPYIPEQKTRKSAKGDADSKQGIKTVKSDDGWSFTCVQEAAEAAKTKPQEDPKKVDREKEEEKQSKNNNGNSNNTANSNELDLRIKFLRDAFFYYMIGFHPDEQINAILAILEYGDRRQEFVMEAHNMRKLGKKFNVSQVSSRSHSFVQEQFR